MYIYTLLSSSYGIYHQYLKNGVTEFLVIYEFNVLDDFLTSESLTEDHEYLHGYLDQLCDDGVRSSVVDWAIGGGVYADYLDVCSVVEDMKKSADPTPAKLEQLRPRLLALCSRLNNLKCHTATHRFVFFIIIFFFL